MASEAIFTAAFSLFASATMSRPGTVATKWRVSGSYSTTTVHFTSMRGLSGFLIVFRTCTQNSPKITRATERRAPHSSAGALGSVRPVQDHPAAASRRSASARGADRNGEWSVSREKTFRQGEAVYMRRWSATGIARSRRHSTYTRGTRPHRAAVVWTGVVGP